MSSLGIAGAPVDIMIPPSMILFYIGTTFFIVLICNVSDVNWMNDDRGSGWGLRRKKMLLHSRHSLVRPDVGNCRQEKKYIGWIGRSWRRATE